MAFSLSQPLLLPSLSLVTSLTLPSFPSHLLLTFFPHALKSYCSSFSYHTHTKSYIHTERRNGRKACKDTFTKGRYKHMHTRIAVFIQTEMALCNTWTDTHTHGDTFLEGQNTYKQIANELLVNTCKQTKETFD